MTNEGFCFASRRGGENKIPAVQAVFLKHITFNPPANRMCFPQVWALDYPYSDSGLTRALKRGAPWFTRSPGTACLFPPGVQFWEDPTRCPTPILFSYITFFRGEDLDLEKYVAGGKGFCVFHDQAGRLGDLLRETALQAGKGGASSFWGVTANLYRVAEILHSSKSFARGGGRVIDGESVAPPADEGQLFVERVREYLRERLAGGIGIDDLARHVGASPSLLSHKYKALTGETPMRTLMELRVAAAKNLLCRGESVKGAAARTGFCDEFHMSKTFKRLTGCAPSRFWP